MAVGLLALLLIDAVLFVASALLMPRPKLKGVSPTFPDRPTSKEGNPIPVIFGTVSIPANVIHFSDVTAVEQKEKVKTGIFSSHEVTVGYSYSAVMQVVLCHGPIDALEDIVWQDIMGLNDTREITTQENVMGKFALVTTTVDYTDPSLPKPIEPVDNGTEFVIFADELFGGYKHGGGVQGLMALFWGTQTQNASATLEAITGITPFPQYRGIAHAVFGRKIGTDPTEPFNFGEFGTIPPLAIVVRRCPSHLGLGAGANINGGANPAEAIYEVLTNTVWGLMIPTSEINTASFTACGTTLASEGLGIHLALNQTGSGDETLTELLRYVDGQVQQNPVTGLLEMSLNRNDYDVSLLVSLDDSNSTSEVTRPLWGSLVNQVKVNFTTKRGAKYVQTTTQPVDDIATQREFGIVHSVTIPFLGVQDPVLANQLAVRELRKGATPLQRAKIVTNRVAAGLMVGKPFKLTNAAAGVNQHVFRVVDIDYGSRTDGAIEIQAIEDIFSLESPFYANPIDPPASWTGVGPVGPVRVAIESTNDASTGYLTLTLAGGNGLATAVQFREQSGNATISAWHDNDTVDEFATQVDLDEKHPSLIGWRVLGHLKDGSIGALAEGEANYPIGTAPARPNLTYTADPSGHIDLIVDVDQDAASFKYVISYDHIPTKEEVEAGISVAVPLGTTRVIVEDVATLTFANPFAYAGAIAYDADGNPGPIATLTITAANNGQYGMPQPTIGPISGESTAEDGEAGGCIHLKMTFDVNTAEIFIYTEKAQDIPVPVPEQIDNKRVAIVTRQEGDIASAFDWETQVDVATPAGWIRRMYCVPIGPTGIKGEPVNLTRQAIDSGLSPLGPPTGMSVVMSVIAGKARATISWTDADGYSDTLVWRNGIMLKSVPTGTGTLVDDGLTPDIDYYYRLQHFFFGTTSKFTSIGTFTSDTPTLVAPTFAATYPRNGGYDSEVLIPPPNGQVIIRVVNPDPLASTVVFCNNNTADTGSFFQCGTIPPGQSDIIINAGDVVGTPTNLQRWFYIVSTRTGYLDSAPSSHETATFGF